MAQGKLAEALTSYGDGLAISERLAMAAPNNAGWQRDLIVSSIFFAAYWTVAMVLMNAPNVTGAVILTAAGALAGALWYVGMRWWMKTRA